MDEAALAEDVTWLVGPSADSAAEGTTGEAAQVTGRGDGPCVEQRPQQYPGPSRALKQLLREFMAREMRAAAGPRRGVAG